MVVSYVHGSFIERKGTRNDRIDRCPPAQEARAQEEQAQEASYTEYAA